MHDNISGLHVSHTGYMDMPTCMLLKLIFFVEKPETYYGVLSVYTVLYKCSGIVNPLLCILLPVDKVGGVHFANYHSHTNFQCIIHNYRLLKSVH